MFFASSHHLFWGISVPSLVAVLPFPSFPIRFVKELERIFPARSLLYLAFRWNKVESLLPKGVLV